MTYPRPLPFIETPALAPAVPARFARQRPPHSQRGMTLILVLLFLVALTMVAIAGMRNVSTGERVIATERDRSLAFQGAESAGREAVAKITDGTAAALSPGYYSAPLTRGGNAEFWRTTSSLPVDSAICATTDVTKRFNWTGCSASTSSAFGNSTSPRYVIERLPDVVNGTLTEQWYRITTRASGGSNEADVILQIMFSKT